MRALRAAFPGDELTLAAPAWLTPLIDLIGGVDRVLPTDGLTLRTWPGVAPSLAVNLHGSGPESHRLLQQARPARLWAFRNPAAHHLNGPAWSDAEHEVHRWCRLLRHYGVTADESDLSLAIPPVAMPGAVTIVHPGAKAPSRRWPVERYAEVARHLHAAGHHVMITGSRAERGLTARVAADAGLDPSLLPSTDLTSLAALVAHARLLISGDTGIAHLASAYRTPSVTLFGPMSPARWGPPDHPRHQTIWHGAHSGRGDEPGPAVHPALLTVTPDQVLAAAEHALHAVSTA